MININSHTFRFCSLLTFAFCLSFKTYAQIGGKYAFEFLQLSDNARVNALGGQNIAIDDFDVNSFQYNPAAISERSIDQIGINYLPFYAKTKKTSVNYGFSREKSGNWGVSLSYLDYGKIDQSDVNGLPLGELSAREYSLGVTKNHQIGPYTMGATMKIAGSHLASYTAYALLLDFGGIYSHPKADFKVGLAVKNLGFVLNDYHDNANSNTPLDVQVSLAYKPQHMPFRTYVTMHHLNQWDIQYIDGDAGDRDENGELIPEEKKTSEQILRHFTFGIEAVFSDNFHLRTGYNHMRRKEMAIEERGGMTGFSLGFMMRVKRFNLEYTRAFYHIAKGVDNLSVTFALNRRTKKEITLEE